MELLLLGLLPLLAFGIFGSNDNDDDNDEDNGSGSGNPDDQIIRDGNGQSLIDGGDGNDLMFGSGGRDDLSGDAGSDLLVGGSDADTLSGGDDADVLLGGTGTDDLFGGNGDDVLVGGARADEVFGGAGDDLLLGSSGADTLNGNGGDDELIGLDIRQDLTPDDLLDLDTADLTTILQETYGDALTDSDTDRVIAGIINSDATDQAPDELDGGDGADGLAGDSNDTLLGGAGTDEFTVYNEAGDPYVTILDFDAAVESLIVLVDGPATGTLTYSGSPDGVAVLLSGEFVAFLDGVSLSALVPGSITVQSAAA